MSELCKNENVDVKKKKRPYTFFDKDIKFLSMDDVAHGVSSILKMAGTTIDNWYKLSKKSTRVVLYITIEMDAITDAVLLSLPDKIISIPVVPGWNAVMAMGNHPELVKEDVVLCFYEGVQGAIREAAEQQELVSNKSKEKEMSNSKESEKNGKFKFTPDEYFEKEKKTMVSPDETKGVKLQRVEDEEGF